MSRFVRQKNSPTGVDGTLVFNTWLRELLELSSDTRNLKDFSTFIESAWVFKRFWGLFVTIAATTSLSVTVDDKSHFTAITVFYIFMTMEHPHSNWLALWTPFLRIETWSYLMMKELVLNDEDIGISWVVEIASCLEGIALYVLSTYFWIPKNGGHGPLHYHLQSNVCYACICRRRFWPRR